MSWATRAGSEVTDEIDIEVSAPPEERSWLRSTAFWSVIGGIGSVITAITAVAAVFVGVDQLNTARELQGRDATFNSWNLLNAVTLENPDLACPNTEQKFRRLMTEQDPESKLGATWRDRYTAYGYMVITTSEQILAMAPGDERWEFLIRERMRCHAPALRSLQADGTFKKRYSCRLQQIVAEELKQPKPSCSEK